MVVRSNGPSSMFSFATHVQSHVAFHRAALLLFGAPSRLTPWSTADRTAAEGTPSSLLRLSARKPEPSVTDFGDHRCRTRCSAGESFPGTMNLSYRDAMRPWRTRGLGGTSCLP